MSRSRISHELPTRNVPLSLSRSRRRSTSRRRDEVPIHRRLGDSSTPATMDGRYAAMIGGDR